MPHRETQMQALEAERCNSRYLPGIAFPAALRIDHWHGQALAADAAIVIATPVAALRETAASLATHYANQPLAWLCKGFEPGTARLPHEVVQATLPHARACVLTGPSFAQEVATGLPAALTLAGTDAHIAAALQPLFHTRTLRVYASDDLVGCELGGALKNVMAIATGIADGMGLGLNARAALMTRGLAELTRLGVAMGARADTFMGLTGMGDLLLTCTGDLSRNRAVGLALGKGETLATALERLGHVAEGVNAAREAVKLAQQHGVDMPITQAVQQVLAGARAPREALAALLARDATRE
jgi:glycerol-3-phosphate dehydrogenase (NAD(P)+)